MGDIKRFLELCGYDPSKGKLNESGKADTHGYVLVGEVPFYPWYDGMEKEKVYVMVSPQKEMKWGEMRHNVIYAENPDGSGKQTDSIPEYAKERMAVYPQHRNDEYGELFLGAEKDDEAINDEHREFLSKLFIRGNNVVLHHNSSATIKDGLIRRGSQNNYSNNSDVGTYFWAGKESGRDPSGYGDYTYYCLISKEDIYDFSTNAERLSLRNAMKKYPYCGQYWQGTDAIVVTTYHETPIWRILDKTNGKWYDSKWKEVKEPF